MYLVILSLKKMDSSFRTLLQSLYRAVHLFVAFIVAKYSIFINASSFGNEVLFLVTFLQIFHGVITLCNQKIPGVVPGFVIELSQRVRWLLCRQLLRCLFRILLVLLHQRRNPFVFAWENLQVG